MSVLLEGRAQDKAASRKGRVDFALFNIQSLNPDACRQQT
jgi:hypothetical protein